MSKIGNRPIPLPAGVTVTIQGDRVHVAGPKGQLSELLVPQVSLEVIEGKVHVTAANQARQTKANHGLLRSLVANMVIGVSTGYTKKLELVGTGYRVAKKGTGLTLTVGYSHPVEVAAPAGILLETEGNTTIIVSGASKYMVGQVSADIRRIRPPEPYKGKGIRYTDEVIRRKQGKAAAK